MIVVINQADEHATISTFGDADNVPPLAIYEKEWSSARFLHWLIRARFQVAAFFTASSSAS